MRIVLPGGSGQVGNLLARHFTSAGHSVTVLSRGHRPAQAAAPCLTVWWDGETAGDWIRALDGADVCINLAGRSVNCRYGAKNRQRIYESRIRSTRLLGEAMASLSHPPRLWLNASTATIYRHEFDRPMDEATGVLGGDEPGAPDSWNFSIRVAKDWEAAFFAAPLPNTRRVAMRSAIVCSPDRGGALAVLLNLARFGLGATMGTGEQYVSWIHEADFARAVDWLIENERLEGAVNLAAPNPLPNREFLSALRLAMGVPIGLPVAAWMIELGAFLLGTEPELVLKSRRVVPGRLLESGFRFRYPEWLRAANDLVARWRRGSASHGVPRRDPLTELGR